jgi:hypothetical protein
MDGVPVFRICPRVIWIWLHVVDIGGPKGGYGVDLTDFSFSQSRSSDLYLTGGDFDDFSLVCR